MADRNDRRLHSGSQLRFWVMGVLAALIAVLLVGCTDNGAATATKGLGAAAQQGQTPANTAAASASGAASPTASPAQSPSAGVFTGGDVQISDTAYQSQDLSVKIKNVNENGVNYYVADCRQLGNKLFTAFATDAYATGKAEQTSVMARRKGAVIAINGDYFGSKDNVRKGRGIVIRNGKLYRSTPYYDVAAVYKDGTMKTLANSDTSADQLMADGALQAFCFGPMLLDGNGKAFSLADIKKRPPLVNPANPRSGIGYIGPNHFVLVVADGRGAGGSKGLTQEDFAKVFESLGCKSAYALDGGGSATMVFMGKVINHPCDASGERSVSDIVYFGENETDQANIDRQKNP
jgi:exopolysaccharide biosynthesis protein